MKIAIFTEEEYVYLYPAWVQSIVALSKAGHTIAGVWLFPSTLKGMRGGSIVHWTLRTFGLRVTVRLAWRTLWARLCARSGFVGMAERAGIPVFRADSPNDAHVVEWVGKEAIDVVFITVGHIIKPPLLSAVRRAVINKHGGLLPAYRGLLPVFWTLLHKQIPIGVTVHEVVEKIDAGRILTQRSYPTFRGSVSKAYEVIYADMPELLVTALEVLNGGQARTVDMPRTASYYSLPSREEVNRFFAEGGRFV